MKKSSIFFLALLLLLTTQAHEYIPYKLKVGNLIKAAVFFQGRPLPGKVITIRNRTGGEADWESFWASYSFGIE